MKSPLIWDIETIGTPFDGRVVTVAWQELGEPHAHVAKWEDIPKSLYTMLADPARPKVSHTKYDPRFVRLCYGNDLVKGPVYDTQVQAWILNENQSLKLDSVAYRYCGIKMDKRIRKREGQVLFLCDDGTLVSLDEAPIDQLYAYNLRDVEEGATPLFENLWERLYDSEWLDYFLAEEVPYTEVLLDMECRGFPVDLGRVEVFAAEMENEHSHMDRELHKTGGLPDSFNMSSPDQLAAYLFSKVFELTDALPCMPGEYNGMSAEEKLEGAQLVIKELGLTFTVGKVGRTYIHGVWTLRGRGLRPLTKTDSGKWSVSRPALKTNLAAAKDPWVQELLDYKQIDKLLTTYLRKFPKVAVETGWIPSGLTLPDTLIQDGPVPVSTRIYGRFNQTGTKTGRLSSSEPNLQNIPTKGELGSRVRDLFRVAV